MSEILYVVIPPTRIPYFLAMKEAAVSVHSGFFHILCFFWGCKFKGEAHAVRQRLAKSRGYIGRLGMRTVKMVPLPGMLST